MSERNHTVCPRCKLWHATHQFATRDGYATSCTNCLTVDEKRLLDLYRVVAASHMKATS
jgi:hypothetical protein